MEVHNGSYIGLFGVFRNVFLVISVAEKSQRHSVRTERRLDNVRRVSLVCFGVEIVERLTAVFGMLRQVVIGSVRNTPEFAPTEREEELKVRGRFRIEAKFFRVMVAKTKIFFLYAERIKEITAIGTPIIEPFEVCSRFAEKFEFHLLKFSDSENEVTRSYLVSERFAYLTDAERNLFSRCSLNVFEVYENALCSFGTKIQSRGRILGNALERFEHQVEFSYIGEIGRAAGGAGYVMLFDISKHFLIRPTRRVIVKSVFRNVILDEFIRSVSGLADFAVHKRVGKSA